MNAGKKLILQSEIYLKISNKQRSEKKRYPNCKGKISLKYFVRYKRYSRTEKCKQLVGN